VGRVGGKSEDTSYTSHPYSASLTHKSSADDTINR
jgi:hypothetical protein